MAKITQLKEFIVSIKGDENFKLYDYYDLGSGIVGFLIGADRGTAKLLASDDTSKINVGDQATQMEIADKVELFSGFFGKIISPVGDIIVGDEDKKEVIGESQMFNPSPPIINRVGLDQPLETGMLAIDTMIPIGKGQRELIIGDRSTGKTYIALNTMINQAKNVKTVYVSIGQKKANVMEVHELLKKHDAHDNAIIVYASPNNTYEQFIAPMIGLAYAEALAYSGEDVLVVIDDLTKHANVYREIALSTDRNPGREAYPNDIFYMHSRLLERGGRFDEKFNNGTITILPIVETIEGDIASVIPSNIISITDGQIFTSTELFNKGEFPAIDIQMSVSRTGSAVQTKLIASASKNLKADHARFKEIQKFAGMSLDMSDELMEEISKSKQLAKILLQFGNVGYSNELIVMLVQMYRAGIIDGDSDMREIQEVSLRFLNEDPVGKKLKEMVNDTTKSNEQISRAIRAGLSSVIEASKGKFGNMLSEKEFNELKGEQ